MKLGIRLAILLLAAACVSAYSNTFNVPFLFDDTQNIIHSHSIKSLKNISDILATPPGEMVGGRPVGNFTFALNWAISGNRVWSYHVFNLLVHVLAALFLFGVARRTLLSGKLRRSFGKDAVPLAFFIALLWGVHPLHTEAVTYISQRFESIMGLFSFMTLYLAIRGWESDSPAKWHLAAGCACTIGAGAKEVMVVIPFLVLFYDVIFNGQNPARALRRSPCLYASMTAALALIAILLLRGSTAQATPKPEWGWFTYLVTEARVICRYLYLSFWPDSLCFDYNWRPSSFKQALPYLFVLLALILGSLFAFFRRMPIGFLAAWFFMILAPTSSVMPLPFFIWERRMYLPLAAVIALAVTGAYALGQKAFRGNPRRLATARALGIGVACIAALGLLAAAYARNAVYSSAISLWADTVAKKPDNPTAHSNLGAAYFDAGKKMQAMAEFLIALKLKPGFTDANVNLGVIYSDLGHLDKALEHFQSAIKKNPGSWNAYTQMGVALARKDRLDEAARSLSVAVSLNPNFVEAQNNLGIVLARKGLLNEGIQRLSEAVALNPYSIEAQNNLAYAYFLQGQYKQARIHVLQALRIKPDFGEALGNLRLIEKALAENGTSAR